MNYNPSDSWQDINRLLAGFIFWGTWIALQPYTTIHPIYAEILHLTRPDMTVVL